ncbi:hypothetical protein [Streptomyces acidiscabies]|uniref:Uncharacterized protein n=1 Tax=Streptomyces acidiscabies TaxID=42234 RepID=A0AAP6BJ08_9ACTN|nr:hypothetical protein [Streptomyces acidiscabies]MBP5935404.1 hypothetical protein [Streptomyces sp. LBUM 1476]MBZ3916743.1 hypothetical protein [Streptomyces acidiscabies]MDX2965619.1 hypothetical protein [Streptomyces acidiscabies]MDX3024879.1 hypothetical protein [Streptomyces acidiscabies]MDX3795535.1 hypothetical protein [Streptomyces acidiscabies]
MSPEPGPVPAQRALSPLDQHIEAVTGHDTDTLWTYRDRGVLDEPHARLVDRHRELAEAQTGVTFYRVLLQRLASGEFEVDGALLTRITRTVEQLAEAVAARDAAAGEVLAALEPVEAAAAAHAPGGNVLSVDDHAALLAIAGGATFREHLLTGQKSAVAASGTRIPHTTLRRLEDAGLAVRDTSHPEHDGQEVALTDAGRAALLAARRTPTSPAGPATPPAAPMRRR